MQGKYRNRRRKIKMHKINEDGTISIIKPTLTIDEANIIGTLKAQHAIEMQKLKDEINQLKAKNEQLKKDYKIVREINDAYYEKYVKNRPVLKSVTYNPPATIAFWEDGTKTVSKCSKNDIFSKECGLALCYMYKMFGKKETKEILKEHCWLLDYSCYTDGSTITASKLTINCAENVPENTVVFSDEYKKALSKLIDEILLRKEIKRKLGW